MQSGDDVVRWSIYASLLLAWIAAAWVLALPGRRRSDRGPLIVWTTALVFYLLHVALAFHVHHGWSHTAAYRHVADETRRLVGWDSGLGLYLNYLFTVGWCIDVVARWRWPHPTSMAGRAARRLWIAFFLFIVINATIVFESGVVRWASAAAVAALGLIAAARMLARKRRAIAGAARASTIEGQTVEWHTLNR